MNVELFYQTLPYMVKGLAGIFFVTLVIMLSIWILNVVTKPRKKKDSQE